MTKKEHFILYLHKARTDHIRWINNVKLLISGIEVDEKTIALNPAESPFGIWYYSTAILLSNGSSRLVLEDIEKTMISIHDVYMKIYPIYFGKKSKSLLGFGKRNNISIHETTFAQHYYEEIVVLSDQLKNKLHVFESQISAASNEKFEPLFFDENEAANPGLKVKETLKDETEESGLYHYGARGRG